MQSFLMVPITYGSLVALIPNIELIPNKPFVDTKRALWALQISSFSKKFLLN